MQTVHDIQQQQVLDNLAMFVANPTAFPYFSIASQGSTAVVDQAGLSVAGEWQRALGVLYFYQLLGTPSANRSDTENWTLNPVNDSVKLSLMRCAYQRVVGSCVGISPACIDPDCNKLFDAFYPAPKLTLPLEGDCCVTCNEPQEPSSQPQSRGLPHVPGIITPYALTSNRCWFCWGPKAALPEYCDPNFMGHYRDTYVWVSKQGRNELTKLTLLILDIAYYDPSRNRPHPPSTQICF